MKKTFKLEIASRLRGFLEERGIPQAEFARTVGFTPGYINDIIRGRTKPSLHLLSKLKDIYKVSIEWVLTGRPSPTSHFERPVVVEKSRGGTRKARYMAIPMLRNPKASIFRGRAVVVKDLHPDYCCIVPRNWVENPKDTFCTLIMDSSMDPTIPRGSHAGVDCTKRNPAQLYGKLCAVRDKEGRLLIRRLRPTKTHLLFEPDNPAVRGETLCVGVDEESHIVGKVEWACSLLK